VVAQDEFSETKVATGLEFRLGLTEKVVGIDAGRSPDRWWEQCSPLPGNEWEKASWKSLRILQRLAVAARTAGLAFLPPYSRAMSTRLRTPERFMSSINRSALMSRLRWPCVSMIGSGPSAPLSADAVHGMLAIARTRIATRCLMSISKSGSENNSR